MKNDPKTKTLLRECPICLASFGDILYNQGFILAEGSPLPKSYDIVSCHNCGFVFADTAAKQDSYDIYYNLFSKYEDKNVATGGGETAWDAARLEEVANVITKVVTNKSANILDIGCANGGLLNYLKLNGYENLLGIDPAQLCIENLKSLGIKGTVGSLFSIDFTSEGFFQKYDCIVLSHVFEHIYDLQLAVKNVFLALKRDGIIYIEVPDASRYPDYFVVPFYYFDCEHINHFDENHVKNLFAKYSFQSLFYGKKELLISGTRYPAVYIVLQKKNTEVLLKRYPVTPSFKARDAVVKFINISRQKNEWNELNHFVKSQEKIVVWGAGNFTLRLLGSTSLGECNILYFVDKDSKKHGQVIQNIKVLDPIVLKSHTGPIVICSALHSQAIFDEIKAMGLDNKIYIIK